MDTLIDDLNKDVVQDVYAIPGVMAFLQFPDKSLQYIRIQMSLGIATNAIVSLASFVMIWYKWKVYWRNSKFLWLITVWIVLLNALTFLCKLYVYNKLIRVRNSENKDSIRQDLKAIFKKRYFKLHLNISTANVLSFFFLLPIIFILWKCGFHESFDLQIYVGVFIIRASLQILLYKIYFLDTQNAARSSTNPNGFREIIYDPETAKNTDPKLLEDPCVICMAEYEPGDKIFEFACDGKHYFHQECLNRWLTNKATCPMCKVPAF